MEIKREAQIDAAAVAEPLEPHGMMLARNSTASDSGVRGLQPMTVSAAQAAAFYREVIREQAVFGVRDSDGFPAPMNGDGERSMPFWSLRSRAERIAGQVEAYAGFQVVEIPLDEFLAQWLPGLERDGLRVGLNWSGRSATGYDVPATDVARRLDATIASDD